mmetsp:Transcript_51549/g.137586  ORF Transcript_51549/g.137586 Transcript_51549/m.137586 type:complete len:534 (-) Transcript_51549:68-1669(-)
MLRIHALLTVSAVLCVAQDDDELKDKVAAQQVSYTPLRPEGLHWVETFDGDVWSRWTHSGVEKYNGEFRVQKRLEEALVGDLGLVVPDAAKHYGVSASFAPLERSQGQNFVVQFEVKFQEGLSCGGSYIKLFNRQEKEAKDWEDSTGYLIMFGPDRCGSTDKVHFILQHRNPITGEWEEKHFSSPPSVPNDTLTHLYQLIINTDNTFEINVDGEKKAGGNLLTDMQPAVNPPKEIDDPEDVKPSDWIDDSQMDEPDARKPEEWDEDAPSRITDPDASMPDGWLEHGPKRVPDPSAHRPKDWDDEEDGEWETPMVDNPDCKVGCGKWKAPTISNPDYKGKWHAPRIDNPAYIGVWKPALIDNPDYFVDESPNLFPKIDSVGIDIWTMSGGILFDNIALSADVEAAKQFADQSFAVRNKIEVLQDAAKKPKPSFFGYLDLATTMVLENPIPAGCTAGVVLVATFLLFCWRNTPPERVESIVPGHVEPSTAQEESQEENEQILDSTTADGPESNEVTPETQEEETAVEGGLGLAEE